MTARMSGAERQSRHRQRLAMGRAVLQIEVDLVEAVEMLIEGGLLRDWTDDRRLIEQALARQVENLCRLEQ